MDKEKLGAEFRQMMGRYNGSRPEVSIREQIRYYLHFDENTFARRLSSLVKDVIESDRESGIC